MDAVLTRDEVRTLVEQLHELWFDEERPLVAVDESGETVDAVAGLVERLRFITDVEYAELAYGLEDSALV